MSRPLPVTMIVGTLLALCFIGIAAWLLFFPGTIPLASREDLRLYALLTGAYGIWRLVRVWMVWKQAEENV
ncbi:hypothetical protein [Chlorobium ferrooxidans]|uniref:hypothetical protein n=1 Tax=Chlorobium ferrooxidans TaxID=84205 RepID=UPI001E287003|nr:hypothetical protein [Chlorobium ferrooxidans]